jgi:hypothetical protein
MHRQLAQPAISALRGVLTPGYARLSTATAHAQKSQSDLQFCDFHNSEVIVARSALINNAPEQG